VVAAMCLGAFPAQAQFNYNGGHANNTNWGFNGNWSGGSHPMDSTQTATFDQSVPKAPPIVTLVVPKPPPSIPIIGTLNLDGSIPSGYTFQGGTLQLGGAATINVQSHNPFSDFAANATIDLLNNAIINTSPANSTLRVAGGITGNFGLTKEGPGTLTLSGTDTYTGNTAVTAGTRDACI
jgi:autotransporter-associated beta strand protein